PEDSGKLLPRWRLPAPRRKSGVACFGQVTRSTTARAGGRATGLVHVTVLPVNHAPTAVDTSAITSEGRPVAIDPIAPARDVDGDPIRVASVTQGTHGAVVGPDGTLNYTPAPGFSGVDHFSYTISDDQGGTLVLAATVTVHATVDGVVFLDRNADGVRNP